MASAQQLLENYVFTPANANRNLGEPRLELYRIYHRQGNTTGCERLEQDALAGPVTNLQDYAQLVDFMDLSAAMIDIPIDSSDRIKAPDEPLDSVSFQEGIHID